MNNDLARPHRVAVYYAPAPESDWWRAGSRWLGRCAATGLSMAQTPVTGLSATELQQVTQEPRRYGWHATLKAPFCLAEGHDVDSVMAGVQSLCRGRTPFELAPLRVTRMGNFLGLRPQPQQPALEQLAADCVRQLQPLAAPLGDNELARRRRAKLTPEQDALLQAWGYPWVFDQFRFHLSLTGPLDTLPLAHVEALTDEAARQFHGLGTCTVDRVSVFVEPTAGADFRLVEQVRFQP